MRAGLASSKLTLDAVVSEVFADCGRYVDTSNLGGALNEISVSVTQDHKNTIIEVERYYAACRDT